MAGASFKSLDSGNELQCADVLLEHEVESAVGQVLASTAAIDMHTHLFPPSMGTLGLWGIDELITYHYLEAEFFRSSNVSPEEYWSLPKQVRCDAIWRALFVENTPVSESTRGVIAVLNAFNLPTEASDLAEARAFFSAQKADTHVQKVFQMSGVSSVVMTNDPLDPDESRFWINGFDSDLTFQSALRLDRILREWSNPWDTLAKQGYAVDAQASGRSISELRRFLADWYQRMRPAYMAVSLPDTFHFPDGTPRGKMLREAVLPACREFNIPLSLMIGVRRQVNPRLRLAGDAVGKADLRALENICRDYPENHFLVSVLSRENQHELCVYIRKFNNLMPFGCWWFLNNPSIVEEITRERIELLGTSFIPQHSDARVLEQLIYKWRNTRATVAQVLAQSYRLLIRDGRPVRKSDIQRDVQRLFRSNFEHFSNHHS